MFIRIQLAKPENAFLSAQAYNEVMTMHGTTMIFLVAMPLLFALMNAVVPLQIGARDVSFPFLNSLGFWLFFSGHFLKSKLVFGRSTRRGLDVIRLTFASF